MSLPVVFYMIANTARVMNLKGFTNDRMPTLMHKIEGTQYLNENGYEGFCR